MLRHRSRRRPHGASLVASLPHVNVIAVTPSSRAVPTGVSGSPPDASRLSRPPEGGTPCRRRDRAGSDAARSSLRRLEPRCGTAEAGVGSIRWLDRPVPRPLLLSDATARTPQSRRPHGPHLISGSGKRLDGFAHSHITPTMRPGDPQASWGQSDRRRRSRSQSSRMSRYSGA